jgi:L-fuconolactonase
VISVDAHHHIWRLSRGDYGWLTPDLPIHRDYMLDDLRPLLGDIEATVLVQAAPTVAETTFMLDVARSSAGLVRAVVGWVDFMRPDAPACIERMSRDPLLKGLRPMLQDIEDTDWILRNQAQPAMAALITAGLRFDALVQPRHLPVLLTLCQRYPELRLVIDHGAKPAIASQQWQPWANDIARIARETQSRCKLSGLVTEARADWRMDELRRYVDHIVACFGANRVMWGSDWPVVNLAGGYTRWHHASIGLLAQLPPDEAAMIMGGTAADFYGITMH